MNSDESEIASEDQQKLDALILKYFPVERSVVHFPRSVFREAIQEAFLLGYFPTIAYSDRVLELSDGDYDEQQ
jgi:hypothetical protein